MDRPGNVTSAADRLCLCSDTTTGIDINFIIIHMCGIIRPKKRVVKHEPKRMMPLSNSNRPTVRRLSVRQTVTSKCFFFFFPQNIVQNNPHRDSHHAIKSTAASALKTRHGGWFFKVNTALSGAGVLKKTVRSAKPARLNININMLAQALALADSIKLQPRLSDKLQM